MFGKIKDTMNSREFQTAAGQVGIAVVSIVVSSIVSQTVNRGLNAGLERLLDKIHANDQVPMGTDYTESQTK